MKRNYQKELDKIIAELQAQGKVPTLLLHSCCAPCSSYVLENLSQYFSITVFYYNPNITDAEEYHHRVEEQKRLIAELPTVHPVTFAEGNYEPERFFEAVRGLEHIPEGGERCRKCFELRLSETAKLAAERGYDYFTTTLTISPLKNAEVLNEIGQRMAAEYSGNGCRLDCPDKNDWEKNGSIEPCSMGAKYLLSDFKKRDGYKRSIELSKDYGLYRQDYCGCVFSEMERREMQKNCCPSA
ncbi:MAG: epoxyqueuosine reductase QueH [Lachnospiraceae bacterium]|nr:epoxyqueuosine reductase QueH [Lachnospiraceae bacterium]